MRNTMTLAFALAASVAVAEPRSVTLLDAVQSARTRTAAVRATAAEVEQAEADAKVGKGSFCRCFGPRATS